ncbi:cytochrome c-type biogenesis protein [Methylobrevis pamukkalensis]|uniref:Cytochrome c-type biogenesis protein n=1 Tax=Methylobrevis pamukkalensis TaxID=1439726 RepID=A0A1E3H2L4_9HYPH|nr:cytochrome c-type biogenesis protein [Methylobrevis pamukkalensis]ODN70562.1 Cytochrome c-type biogenesis protein CcmH precursor [Methylobrevis pamukkalensis]
MHAVVRLRRTLAAVVVVLAMAMAMPFAAGPAFAVQPDEVMQDPAQEARARALSSEIRCMVCQNQSIDDSDADLARDLRILVRERIAAGDSDADVLDFLVERYGEFVLLKPRFSASNLVLWAAAPIVLIGGIGAILVAWRRRRAAPASETGLSRDEEARLARILDGENR